MKLYSFEKSYKMFEDAKRMVPNGIYGPRSPHFLTFGSYPCFFTRGKGSHVWDVDGNEYIDYMCSFGTNVLGMCNPEVDEAAIEQMKRGESFTLPTDRWNELAAVLVKQVRGMDWTAFGKNGSDVTTYATSVARRHTGRKTIITINGAYNGAHFWCSHSAAGVPEEYRAHVHSFNFNDRDGLSRLIGEHKGDIAGVMLTPHHHPAMADQVLPDPEFYRGLEALCRKEGIVIIMDDIRCGFRLHENGSHCYYGCDPDIVCFGKAMANGYPISAITGKAAFKAAAEAVYFTGTHFFAAVPMAASIATIDIINRDGVIKKLLDTGVKLRDGMLAQAKAAGMAVHYTGHPVMPFMRFENDADFSVNRLFCGEAARRGVFLHPHHNWFVCLGHSQADIDRTLEVAAECFKIVKEKK
ncbi:MAG: aminotransferase class III-fold pyridoxal phosphate-dependent enzyme [Spirochaetes bacterium]|nr:MAG: aminotransferase class III-fold pyridoxal phosphate-dependent enzyme [Spirochaetota bacterium]